MKTTFRQKNREINSAEVLPTPSTGGRKLTLDGALALYFRLPVGQENTSLAESHIDDIDALLWQQFEKVINTQDNSNTVIDGQNAERRLLETAENLNLPEEVMYSFSEKYYNYSLNPTDKISLDARCIAADIGHALGSGNERIKDNLRDFVQREHEETVDRINPKRVDQDLATKAQLAEAMLYKLDISYNEDDIPSTAATVIEIGKKGGRTAIATGIVVALGATAAFSSTAAAAASENKPPVIDMFQQTIGQVKDKLVVTPVNNKSTETTPPVSKDSPINIDMTIPDKPKKSKAPEEAVAPAPTTEVKPEPKVSIDLNQDRPTPVAPAPVAAPEATTSPEQAPLTPEQKKSQAKNKEITDLINNKSDIPMASSLILEYYANSNEAANSSGDKTASIEMTNTDLLKSAISLEQPLKTVVNARGHADPAYSNTAYMSLAVLEAIASDQTVWKSPDVQGLVSGVKLPEDPYQLRLFNEYVAQAKATLEAEVVEGESKLLKGINVEAHDSIKMMYAYSLLAAVSDADQTAKIEAYKADEAAKAAADAAAKAQDSPNVSEIEAITNDQNKLLRTAVERAAQAHGWSEYKTNFHKALVELGVGLSPMAGLSGNVDIESKGFNPNILEIGFEKNPNRGIGFVQFTNYMGENTKLDGNKQAIGGRRTVYEAAARAAGFDPRKDTSYEFIKWQVSYIIEDSKSRISRDETGNEWEQLAAISDPKESATYFRWNYERPGIPHEASRDKSAQQTFDQLSGQIDAIKQEAANAATVRVAAEAAAAAAETERQAKMGMTFEQAVAFTNIYATSPDSVKHIGNSATNCNGGALSNCVSLSVYFINKHTNFKGMEKGPKANNPGNGKDVAGRIVERNPGTQSGNTAKPYSIFSKLGGEFGHTGLVLGVDENKIASDGTRGVAIIAEAFCTSQSHNGKVKEYSLAYMNSGAFTYAYTDGHIDVPLQ